MDSAGRIVAGGPVHRWVPWAVVGFAELAAVDSERTKILSLAPDELADGAGVPAGELTRVLSGVAEPDVELVARLSWELSVCVWPAMRTVQRWRVHRAAWNEQLGPPEDLTVCRPRC
jgi:hypothetical protein